MNNEVKPNLIQPFTGTTQRKAQKYHVKILAFNIDQITARIWLGLFGKMFSIQNLNILGS